jgi:hypothetical protein
MRKGLALCIALILLAMSAAACGSAKEPEVQPVVVETDVPEPPAAPPPEEGPQEQEELQEPEGPAEPVKDDYSLPFEGMRPLAV